MSMEDEEYVNYRHVGHKVDVHDLLCGLILGALEDIALTDTSIEHEDVERRTFVYDS